MNSYPRVRTIEPIMSLPHGLVAPKGAIGTVVRWGHDNRAGVLFDAGPLVSTAATVWPVDYRSLQPLPPLPGCPTCGAMLNRLESADGQTVPARLATVYACPSCEFVGTKERV